jgi:hypothetical protein
MVDSDQFLFLVASHATSMKFQRRFWNFVVVQLGGFDRMPIFFGGVSERIARAMSSEKLRVFVCEAGRAQFDELSVFRDAGWS